MFLHRLANSCHLYLFRVTLTVTVFIDNVFYCIDLEKTKNKITQNIKMRLSTCSVTFSNTYKKCSFYRLAHSLYIYIYIYIYISGGPLSALTCCVNVRLLSAIKKISPLIYSQSWVGSWVYTTRAMMTFTLIF